MTIVWFALFGGLVIFGTASSGSTPPPGVIVVFGLRFAAVVANLVLPILGCVRASQERGWRYTCRPLRAPRPLPAALERER